MGNLTLIMVRIVQIGVSLMIKIKDDFDLKELRSYGFITDEDEWYRKDIFGAYIYVKPLSREIVLKPYKCTSLVDITVVYYLIKAGLVEVVDDNEI